MTTETPVESAIDEVVLTPHELAFLFGLGASHGAALECLGIEIDPAEQAVQLVGLQSLSARGLATAEADQVHINSGVAAIGDLIRSSNWVCAVYAAGPDAASGGVIFESSASRMLFSPVAVGCMAISQLEAETSLPTMAADVAVHALNELGATEVLVVVVPDADVENQRTTIVDDIGTEFADVVGAIQALFDA